MEEREQTPPEAGGLTFGEELRRERELRNVSLREIADSTKISRRYLQAIEEGDYPTLPAPVFTRGFIREYARYLGLPHDDLIDRYMQHIQTVHGYGQEQYDPMLSHEQRDAEGSGAEIPFAPKGLIVGAVVTAVVIALVAAYFFLGGERGSETTVPAAADSEASEPVETATPEEAVPPSEASGRLTMVIRAEEDSWVTLSTDGKRVFNDVMVAGSEHRFEANEEFRFGTIGNAGGLKLTLNGRQLASLGSTGEVVRDRAFGRETLESLPE